MLCENELCVADDLLSVVVCTACNRQINTNKEGAARRHPVLKVLICKVSATTTYFYCQRWCSF